MDTNDAANLARTLQMATDYGVWMWEHPLFKPVLVLLLAGLIFRLYLGPKMNAFMRFQLKRIDDYYEGKQMRYDALTREQSLLAQDIADVIEGRVDKGDISRSQANVYYRKLGHVLPLLRRAVETPAAVKRTPIEQLKDRLSKLKASKKPESPRERLTRVLNGTTAAT